MGNLAAKCETKWQAWTQEKRMGVRLIRTDGKEVEEFDRPVLAVEIMLQSPDYVIVEGHPTLYTEVSKLGECGQMRVLQPHDLLTPGKHYFLFPIPIELMKDNYLGQGRSSKFKRLEIEKSHLSLLLARSAALSGDLEAGYRSVSVRDFESPVSENLKTSPPETSHSWDRNSPIEAQTAISSTWSNLSPHYNGIASWKPELLSIPESPIVHQSGPTPPVTVVFIALNVESKPMDR